MENRFCVDELFRKNGYEIISRPNKGPSIWKKRGEDKTLTYNELRKLMDVNDLADAVYLEMLESDYWNS